MRSSRSIAQTWEKEEVLSFILVGHFSRTLLGGWRGTGIALNEIRIPG